MDVIEIKYTIFKLRIYWRDLEPNKMFDYWGIAINNILKLNCIAESTGCILKEGKTW